MPTLKDVAKLANVSVTAASVVLSNTAHKRGIAKETQERIFKAAKGLNYQANRTARALRTGKTQMVGILGIHLVMPVPRMLLSAISENLVKHGYNITPIDLAWTRQYKSQNDPLDFNVDINQLDSMVVLDMQSINIYDWIENTISQKIPVIGVENWGLSSADVVTVDRQDGAYQATKHLISLGHKKIVLTVNQNSTQRVIKGRVNGYKKAHEELNIPVMDSMFIGYQEGISNYEAGIQVAKAILNHPDKPTAIFAVNDEVAIGALQNFYEKKIRVPDDIAIVGFDGIYESAYACVPLTTVAQPIDKISEKIVQLMIPRINKKNDPLEKQNIILKPNLVIRKSCGAHLT